MMFHNKLRLSINLILNTNDIIISNYSVNIEEFQSCFRHTFAKIDKMKKS